MKSQNMNYYFNVEYFEGIVPGSTAEEQSESLIKERNGEIVNFCFSDVARHAPLNACRDIPGYIEFEAFTLYPGLLIGTGNPHGIAMEGGLKSGFSFDYVTGLPYIPGSSLKGMLRAYFPKNTLDTEHETFIRQLLGNEHVDVRKLMENMFENNDIFFGAYPIPSESGEGDSTGKLLEFEYITPHKQRYKNPIPISMIKVRPGVKFVFSFAFSDYEEDGTIIVSASEKKELCKAIIMLMGAGAKTNTGFGRFSDQKPKMHSLVIRDEEHGNGHKQSDIPQFTREAEGGKCHDCGATVGFNKKTNRPYWYCPRCSKKHTKK